MKKYRLIKEYPGSPNLGTILEYKNHWGTKGLHYGIILINNPEKFSEYWEEIIEKDYEIIEFIKNNEKREVTYQNGDKITLSPNPDPDSLIWLLNNNYKIHSIKRLSDGEVFTVGDKTNAGNLTGFSIKQNSIITHHNPSGQDLNDDYFLGNLKKIKALFTTEDGVDIYKGDSYYGVDLNKFSLSKHTIGKLAPISQNYKRFSTKEKAEEYILLNKPCLSINEVTNTIPFLDKSIIKLIELVKQKIKEQC